MKIRSLKTCVHHPEPDSFSTLKDFSHEIGGDISDFLISYNEMCQYLEDHITQVNPSIPNNQGIMYNVFNKNIIHNV